MAEYRTRVTRSRITLIASNINPLIIIFTLATIYQSATTNLPMPISSSQVNRNQRVIVAKIQDAVRERRIRAHGLGQYLGCGDLLKGRGGRDRENELPGLAHDQQPSAGERHAPRTEPAGAPQYLSALQIDRAEYRAELLTAVKSVEASVVQHARCVVVREHLIRQPYVLELRP